MNTTERNTGRGLKTQTRERDAIQRTLPAREQNGNAAAGERKGAIITKRAYIMEYPVEPKFIQVTTTTTHMVGCFTKNCEACTKECRPATMSEVEEEIKLKGNIVWMHAFSDYWPEGWFKVSQYRQKSGDVEFYPVGQDRYYCPDCAPTLKGSPADPAVERSDS